INVPEHTASLLLSRTFRVQGTELTLGGGVRHVGERLGETATTFELPDYTLARVYAAWQPTERLALRAEIDNLFGEEWYPSSFSRLWVAPGAPRRGSLSLRYRF
ncbi:MAG: TonB-dependent receptor domain-containing protein, partial [Pseudomonadota bacterium]